MTVRRNVTLKDIAKATGVGVSAVSRVLNNSRTGSRVSEATRQRIVEAAKTMRYQTNAVAQSLDRRQTGIFGVVLGWTADLLLHPYIATLLQGIVDGAAETNYQPILYTTSWQEAEENISMFTDRRADGLIVVAPPVYSTMIQRVQEYGVPVVGYGPCMLRGSGYSIALDEYQAIDMAIEHLQALGHREIAYISGTLETHSFQYRQDIAKEVMKDRHVEKAAIKIIDEPWPITNRSAGIRAFLNSPDRPTAILAYNDVVAISILEVAKELGIAVPEQLSVVGFDDIPPAATSNPPLTTIHQPTREMGKAAVHLLKKLIMMEVEDEVEFPEPTIFHATLTIRSSTGPVPVG